MTSRKFSDQRRERGHELLLVLGLRGLMLQLGACDEDADSGHALHDQVAGDVSGPLVEDTIGGVAAAVSTADVEHAA